jgi:hypothetical protein
MIITYKVYLDCLKAGLVPNPEEILAAEDVCSGIDCDNCPIYSVKRGCWDKYLVASKKHYPRALKENPEYLL